MWNTAPSILYANDQPIAIFELQRYAAPLRRISHGVVNKYYQYLLNLVRIGKRLYRLLSINPQLNSLAFGRLNIALGNIMKQFGNVDLGYLHVLCS